MNAPNLKMLSARNCRRSVIVLLCLGIVAGAFIGVVLNAPLSRGPEWSAILRRVSVQTFGLKPPQEENIFHLELTNHSKRNLWFVWTNQTEQQQIEGVFRFQSSGNTSGISGLDIDCKRLGGRGVLRMIRFRGERSGDSFFALLLKPNAQISCKQMPVVTFGRLNKLIIHVAPLLLVDGNIPLEDWLPYDPGNYGEITLDADTYEFGSGLNRTDHLWKPGKGIGDLRALRLEFVEIRPTGTHAWAMNPRANQ